MRLTFSKAAPNLAMLVSERIDQRHFSVRRVNRGNALPVNVNLGAELPGAVVPKLFDVNAVHLNFILGGV